MGSDMTDYGCGRCDCHHEMVEFRLRKKPRSNSGATRRPNLRLTLTNARTRSGSFSSLPCRRSRLAVDAGLLQGTNLVTRPLLSHDAVRKIGLVWRRGTGRRHEFRLLAKELNGTRQVEIKTCRAPITSPV